MGLDLYTSQPVLYSSKQKVEERKPYFYETVGATIGYQYAPFSDYMFRHEFLDNTVDPNFKSIDHMEGYEQYPELLMAPNKTSQDFMKLSIDRNVKRREVLYKSSIPAQFFAGMFDPINIVALPFGGPTVGIGRSALRTGVSVGTLQAIQETYRQPFDPVASPMEPILNVGTATILGSAIGSAFSVAPTRRANAFLKTKEALGNMELSYAPIINRHRPSPTHQRPLSQIDDISIQGVLDIMPSAIKGLDELDVKLRDDLSNLPKNSKDPNVIAEKKRIENTLNANARKKEELRSELAAHEAERKQRINEKAAVENVKNPYSIMKSAWTDSWAYKFVTTPMKRQLQDKQITDVAKKTILDIAGDSGITLELHKFGLSLAPSVYAKAQMRQGEWVQVHDTLMKMYEKEYGMSGQVFKDFDARTKLQKFSNFVSANKQVTYEQWITMVNKKRIKRMKPASEAESEAMAALDKYYSTWSDRLEQAGMLGSKRSLEKRIEYYQNRIEAISKDIDDLLKNKGSQLIIAEKEARLGKLVEKQRELESELQYVKDTPFMPKNEEVFNPRYWNVKEITARRAEFFEILKNWYKANPEIIKFNKKTNKYETIRLKDDDASIEARVNETIDTITGVKDITDDTLIYYGHGKSKHLKHRELDIPNELVADFIELNPVAVMRTYTNRIAPLYEFQVKFNRTIDDVLDDVDDQMLSNGISRDKRNAYLRDARHLYERVVGKVLRDPHSWDQNTATVLKDLAMLNYLGSAGFATLPDMAKILMEHEGRTVFKTLFGVMQDSKVRLSAQEGRIAGEILEILVGDAHLRHTEYLQNNVFNSGFMSSVRSNFHIANLLAPATNVFKKFDAIARGHTLIDYAMKLTRNEASEFEVTYLARYGIDSKMALELKKLVDDGVIEQSANGLYLPNTKKWAENGAKESTIENFRTSMNQGIMNTILMGTPADKPIAVDGVFYVPIHVMRRMFPTAKEDPKFRGYYRVENGLLGLPFQFMSYSFAAANKITAALAQGQIKNRAAIIATAMGLGYMTMELKYSDWQMKQMTLADKIARSFDASGIAALYSDLFYTAMNTTLALGGPNISAGFLNPKFPQDKNYFDAVGSIAGAGPSYGIDLTRAVGNFLMGNMGEGGADILRSLPGAKLWFLKDEVNQFARVFDRARY